MSAYVVDKKVIDVMVARILDDKYGIQGTVFEKHKDNPDAIGQMLWKLNYQSVNYRYNECSRTPKYFYDAGNASVSRIQTYKYFGCWQYQSCEGDFYKTRIYKDVSLIMASLAGDIICDTPEYNNAKWG